MSIKVGPNNDKKYLIITQITINIHVGCNFVELCNAVLFMVFFFLTLQRDIMNSIDYYDLIILLFSPNSFETHLTLEKNFLGPMLVSCIH